jgi:hypothetical protein
MRQAGGLSPCRAAFFTYGRNHTEVGQPHKPRTALDLGKRPLRGRSGRVFGARSVSWSTVFRQIRTLHAPSRPSGCRPVHPLDPLFGIGFRLVQQWGGSSPPVGSFRAFQAVHFCRTSAPAARRASQGICNAEDKGHAAKATGAPTAARRARRRICPKHPTPVVNATGVGECQLGGCSWFVGVRLLA